MRVIRLGKRSESGANLRLHIGRVDELVCKGILHPHLATLAVIMGGVVGLIWKSRNCRRCIRQAR